MNPSEIILENTSKLFEYERISREIEECENLEALKNMLRCYVKLYMKQQELLCQMNVNFDELF
jgi:hypothetical protein